MVLEQWLGGIADWQFRGIALIDLLESAAILVVGYLVIRAMARGLGRVIAQGHIPEIQRELFLRTVRVFLVIALVGLALTPLHIDLTSLVVGFGVLGVVAGFAFQAALSNIAAGILIAASRTFDRGNHVLIANQEGVVEHLGMIATSLRTGDNRSVTVPNALVLGNPIVNFDTYPRRRVDVALDVPISLDLQGFLQSLRRGAVGLPQVPGGEVAPEMVLKGMGEKGVTVEVRVWTPKDRWEETKAALVALLQRTLGEQVKDLPRTY